MDAGLRDEARGAGRRRVDDRQHQQELQGPDGPDPRQDREGRRRAAARSGARRLSHQGGPKGTRRGRTPCTRP
ncbi:hypothetical protein SGPA1_50625 [Streptomyces misionensis JCM 4497]